MPNYNTPTKIYNKSSVVNSANGMGLQIAASGVETSMNIGLKAPSKGIDHFTNSDALTSLELTDKERFDARGATKFLGVEFHPNAIKIEEDIAAIAYDEYTDINKFAIKIDNTGKVGEEMGLYRSGYGQIAYDTDFYKQWEPFDDVWALPMLDRSVFDKMGEHTIVGEREASWSDFGDHYFHNMFIIVEYAGTSHGLQYSSANQTKVAALAEKKQVFKYFERRRWNHQEGEWMTGKLIPEKQIPHGHFYWESGQNVGRDVLKLKIGNKSELAGLPQIPYVEENAPDDVLSVFGEGYQPPINASDWASDYYVTWGRLNIKSIQVVKYTPVVECGKVDIYTRKSGNITGVGERGKVTAPSHGLKDGDIIKISSALTPLGTNDLVDHNHEINGTRYVSIIDGDTIRLYKDGDMSETVSTSTSLRPSVPAETFEAVWTTVGNVFSGDSQGWQYYKSMSSPTGRNGYTHRTFGVAWPNVDSEATEETVTDGHFLFDRILDVFNDDNKTEPNEMPSLVGGVMNKWDWLFATDLQLVDTLIPNELNPRDTDNISYSASFYFPGEDSLEGARSGYGAESKINSLEITNGLLATRNDSQASTLDALWKHPRNFFPHAPCDMSGMLYDTVRKQGSPEFALQKGYRFGSSIDLKKEKVDGSSNVYKLVVGERGASKIPNYQDMRPLGRGEVLDDVTARSRGKNADKSLLEKKKVDYSRSINVFPKANKTLASADSYGKMDLGFEPSVGYHNNLSLADVSRDRLWEDGMGRTTNWNMKAVPHAGAYGKAHLFEIKTDQYGRVTDISFKATYNATSFLNARQSGWAKDPQEFYSNSVAEYTPTKFFTWQDSSGTGLGGTLGSLGGAVHFYNSYRNFYAFKGFATAPGTQDVSVTNAGLTGDTYEKSGMIGSIIGRLDMVYWNQAFNCHWGYEYFNDAYASPYRLYRDEFVQSNYILEHNLSTGAVSSLGAHLGSIPDNSNNSYFNDLSLPYRILDESFENSTYFNVFHNKDITGSEPKGYQNPSLFINVEVGEKTVYIAGRPEVQKVYEKVYYYGDKGFIKGDHGPRLGGGKYGSSVQLTAEQRHNSIWFQNRLHDLYPFVDSFGKAVALDIIDGDVVISTSCKAKAFSEVNDVVAWEREKAKATATGDYKDFLNRLFYIQPSYIDLDGKAEMEEKFPGFLFEGELTEYRSDPLGNNPLARAGTYQTGKFGNQDGIIIDPDKNPETLKNKLSRADMGYVISGAINSSYEVYNKARLILSNPEDNPDADAFLGDSLKGSEFRAQYYKAEKTAICLIAKDKKLLWGESYAPAFYDNPSTFPTYSDSEKTSYIYIQSDSSYSTVERIDHYNYLEGVTYLNTNSAPVDRKKCYLRDSNVNPARMFINFTKKIGLSSSTFPPQQTILSQFGGLTISRGKNWVTISSDRFGDNFKYENGTIVANGYAIKNEFEQVHEDVAYGASSYSDVNVLVDYIYVYESENRNWNNVSKISASIDSEDSNYSYRDVLDVKAGDSLRSLGNINYNNGTVGSKTWDIDLTNRFVAVDDKIILKDPSGYSIFKKRYDIAEEKSETTSSVVCSPYLSFEEIFNCPTQERDKNNQPITTPTPAVTYNYGNLGFRDNPRLTVAHGRANKNLTGGLHTSAVSFFKVPLEGNVLSAIESLKLTFEYQSFEADIVQSNNKSPAVPLVVLYKHDPRETIYPYYLKYPQANAEDTRWLTQSFRGGAQDSHFYRLNSFMGNSDKFYLVDDTFGQAMFGGANYLAKAFIPTLNVSTGTAVGASAGGAGVNEHFVGTVDIPRHDVMNFLTNQDLIKSTTRTISEAHGNYNTVFDDINQTPYNASVAAQEGPSLIIGFLQGNVVNSFHGEKTDSDNAGKLTVHFNTTDSKVPQWETRDKNGVLLRTPYIDSPANDYYYEEASGDNTKVVTRYEDPINPREYFEDPDEVHAAIKVTNSGQQYEPQDKGGIFSFEWDLGYEESEIGTGEPKTVYYVRVTTDSASAKAIEKTGAEYYDGNGVRLNKRLSDPEGAMHGRPGLWESMDWPPTQSYLRSPFGVFVDADGKKFSKRYVFNTEDAANRWLDFTRAPGLAGISSVSRTGQTMREFLADNNNVKFTSRGYGDKGIGYTPQVFVHVSSGKVLMQPTIPLVRVGSAADFEDALKQELSSAYGESCVSVYNGYCEEDSGGSEGQPIRHYSGQKNRFQLGWRGGQEYVTYLVHFKNSLGSRRVEIRTDCDLNIPGEDYNGVRQFDFNRMVNEDFRKEASNKYGFFYGNTSDSIGHGVPQESYVSEGGLRGAENRRYGGINPEILVLSFAGCNRDGLFQLGTNLGKHTIWSPTNLDEADIKRINRAIDRDPYIQYVARSDAATEERMTHTAPSQNALWLDYVSQGKIYSPNLGKYNDTVKDDYLVKSIFPSQPQLQGREGWLTHNWIRDVEGVGYQDQTWWTAPKQTKVDPSTYVGWLIEVYNKPTREYGPIRQASIINAATYIEEILNGWRGNYAEVHGGQRPWYRTSILGNVLGPNDPEDVPSIVGGQHDFIIKRWQKTGAPNGVLEIAAPSYQGLNTTLTVLQEAGKEYSDTILQVHHNMPNAEIESKPKTESKNPKNQAGVDQDGIKKSDGWWETDPAYYARNENGVRTRYSVRPDTSNQRRSKQVRAFRIAPYQGDDYRLVTNTSNNRKVRVYVIVGPQVERVAKPKTVTIELPWGYGKAATNTRGEALGSPANPVGKVGGNNSIVCKLPSSKIANSAGIQDDGFHDNCTVTTDKWRLVLKNKAGAILKTSNWLDFNISASALTTEIRSLADTPGYMSGYYVSVDDQSIVTQTSGLAAVNISAGSSTKRIFKVWDADERASIGVETDASIFLDEDLIIEAEMVESTTERAGYAKASRNAPYVNSRNLDVVYKNDNVLDTPAAELKSDDVVFADDLKMLGAVSNIKPVVTTKAVKNVRRYPCAFAKIAEFNYDKSNNTYDRVKSKFQDKTENLTLRPDKYGGNQYPGRYHLAAQDGTSVLVTSQIRDDEVGVTSIEGYQVVPSGTQGQVNLSIDIFNTERRLRYTNPVLGIGSSKSASVTDNTLGEIRGTISSSNQVLSNDTYYTTSPDQAVYSSNISKTALEENKKKWDDGLNMQSISSLDYQYLRSWDIQKNEFLPLLLNSNVGSSGVIDLTTHGMVSATGAMPLKTVGIVGASGDMPLITGAPTATSIAHGELLESREQAQAWLLDNIWIIKGTERGAGGQTRNDYYLFRVATPNDPPVDYDVISSTSHRANQPVRDEGQALDYREAYYLIYRNFGRNYINWTFTDWRIWPEYINGVKQGRAGLERTMTPREQEFAKNVIFGYRGRESDRSNPQYNTKKLVFLGKLVEPWNGRWDPRIRRVVYRPVREQTMSQDDGIYRGVDVLALAKEWLDTVDDLRAEAPSLSIPHVFGVGKNTQDLLLFSPPPSAVLPLYLQNQYGSGGVPLSVSGPIVSATTGNVGGVSAPSGVQLYISPPVPVSGNTTLVMPTPYGVATTPICDYQHLFIPGVSGVTGSETLFMKVQMPSSGMSLYTKPPKRFGPRSRGFEDLGLLMPPQSPSGSLDLHIPAPTGILSSTFNHFIYGDTVGGRLERDTTASGTLHIRGPHALTGGYQQLYTYFGPNKSDNVIDGDEARCVISYKNEDFDTSPMAEPRIKNTSTNSLALERYTGDAGGLAHGYAPIEEIAASITTYKSGNDYKFYFNSKINESFHNNDDYLCVGLNSEPEREGVRIEIFAIDVNKQITLAQEYNSLESDLINALLIPSSSAIIEAYYKSIQISSNNRIAASITLKTADPGTLQDIIYHNIIFILEKSSDSSTWSFVTGFGNSCTSTSDRLKKDLGSSIAWDGEDLYYPKESSLNGEINYRLQSDSYATEQAGVSFADTDAFSMYRTNLNSRYLEETKIGFGHKIIIKGDLMFVSCPLIDGFAVKNTLTRYSLNAFRGAVFVFKKSSGVWSYTDTVYQGGYDASTLAADSYVCKYTVNLFGYDIAYNERNDILVVGEPATKKVYRYGVNSSGEASFVTQYSGTSDDIDYGASVDVCHSDIITFSKKAILTTEDTQTITYDSKGQSKNNPARGTDARTLSGAIYNLHTGASFNFDINNPYYEALPYVPIGTSLKSVEEKLYHIRLLHFSDNSSALMAGRTFNIQYGLQSNNLIRKLSLLEVANDVYPTLFMRGPLPSTNSLTLQIPPVGSGTGSMSLSLPLRATGQGVNLFLDQRSSSGVLDMHIRTETSGVMPLTLTNYPVSGTHTAPLMVKVALPASGGMELAMPTTLGPVNQGFNLTMYQGPSFQSWPLFLKQRDPIPFDDDSGLLFMYGNTVSSSRDVGRGTLLTGGTVWGPVSNTYELFMAGPPVVETSGILNMRMHNPRETGVASGVASLSVPSPSGWATFSNTSQLYISSFDGSPSGNMNLMYSQKGIGGGDEVEGNVNMVLENKTTSTNINLVASGIYGSNNSVNLLMTSGDGVLNATGHLYIRGYLE